MGFTKFNRKCQHHAKDKKRCFCNHRDNFRETCNKLNCPIYGERKWT